MVKFFGIDAGSPDRFLAGDRGQVHGGKVAQFAAITAHGRARAAYDCNVCSLCHMRNLLYEELRSQGQTLKFIICVAPTALDLTLQPTHPSRLASTPTRENRTCWGPR